MPKTILLVKADNTIKDTVTEVIQSLDLDIHVVKQNFNRAMQHLIDDPPLAIIFGEELLPEEKNYLPTIKFRKPLATAIIASTHSVFAFSSIKNVQTVYDLGAVRADGNLKEFFWSLVNSPIGPEIKKSREFVPKLKNLLTKYCRLNINATPPKDLTDLNENIFSIISTVNWQGIVKFEMQKETLQKIGCRRKRISAFQLTPMDFRESVLAFYGAVSEAITEIPDLPLRTQGLCHLIFRFTNPNVISLKEDAIKSLGVTLETRKQYIALKGDLKFDRPSPSLYKPGSNANHKVRIFPIGILLGFEQAFESIFSSLLGNANSIRLEAECFDPSPQKAKIIATTQINDKNGGFTIGLFASNAAVDQVLQTMTKNQTFKKYTTSTNLAFYYLINALQTKMISVSKNVGFNFRASSSECFAHKDSEEFEFCAYSKNPLFRFTYKIAGVRLGAFISGSYEEPANQTFRDCSKMFSILPEINLSKLGN